MASMDTPFGMSFDELIAQVSAEGNAVSEEPTKAETKAETAVGGLSFDEMVAQAQAGVPKDTAVQSNPVGETERMLSFDELVAQAQAAASDEGHEEPKQLEEKHEAQDSTRTDGGTAPLSFDALVAQAQTAAGISGGSNVETTGTVWNPPSEEVSEGDAKPNDSDETTNEKQTVAGDGDKGSEDAPNLDMNQPETDASEDASDDSQKGASEGKQDAKPAKSKRSSKKKKAVPTEETVLEDKTEEYRVELPQISAKSGDSSMGETAAMDALFTPEEVASLRADIQTFVRRELKLALKGALKEVLDDFSK